MPKFKEAREMMEQIYAVVLPILAKYETPGQSSRHKSQVIAEIAADHAQRWIDRQKPKIPVGGPHGEES